LPKLVDYGRNPETSNISTVYDAYTALTREADSDVRLSILHQVSGSVLEKKVSCSASLPFIFAERDLRIISTAALELAQNSPVRGGDRLEGVRAVYDLAVSSPGTTRIGILMGLAYMGDRRVYDVLKNCWSLLSSSELQRFLRSAMPALYAGYVDFLVGALEQNRVNEGEWATALWGSVLGCLCGLPRSFDKVVDVRRELPLDPRKERQVRVLESRTIIDYGARLWQRFERLLLREPEPQLMPMVMKAWGIQHRDAAVSQGRLGKWLRDTGVRKNA
jgi:hypothetical protein